MIPLPAFALSAGMKYALLAIAVAVLCAGAWFSGYKSGRDKLDEYVVAQATASQKLAEARVIVTEKIRIQYVKVAAESRAAAETIAKEVAHYAEVSPGNCLDPEWRRLHDSAALGSVPAPGSGADGAGRETPTSAVALQTVTENYARCARTADRLTALQSWVREQAAVAP